MEHHHLRHGNVLHAHDRRSGVRRRPIQARRRSRTERRFGRERFAAMPVEWQQRAERWLASESHVAHRDRHRAS